MKKVLIFAGTTEGRVLAKRLEAAGVFCEVCVATQYGEQLLEESGNLMVRRGRLDAGQMRELYGEQEYAAVVDATHPFAAVVTENILESLKGKEIPYFRLARDVKMNWENFRTVSFLRRRRSARRRLRRCRAIFF